MLIAVIFAASMIWLMEVPSLRKKGQGKELWLFHVLLLLGTAAGIMKALQWPVPNPLDWITFVFQPASDALMNLLAGG